MARAFVSNYEIAAITAGQTADTFVVPMNLVFIGTEIPRIGGIDYDRINVQLAFADTINTMQGKIVDAITARATTLGYTLARNGILLPALVKGS